MAIVVYYVIQDAKGQKSTVEIPFPDSTALVDIQEAVGPVAQMINALVTGGLVSAGFRVDMDLSATGEFGFGGWGPVAQLASDVQEKAEFALRTVLGNLKKINLPTFDEQFFENNSVNVDQSDAAVQAFVTFLEDGITGGAEPSDYRGEDLFVLEAASENWGKRRR